MSKGDSVFDNWEEIDELGLTTQLDKLKKEMNPSSATTMHSQNGSVPFMLMMNHDDGYDGQTYTKASKPAVKILRRPTQQTSDGKMNDLRPKQPIKTLQQREQEYAEARLRILGSAKNPEDDLDSTLPKLALKSSSDIVSTENCTSRNNTDCITNNPGDPSSSSACYLNGQNNVGSDNGGNNILRLPRGPDGTNGFNVRR